MKISDLKVTDFKLGERVEVSWGGWTNAPRTVEGMNRGTVMGIYERTITVEFDGDHQFYDTEPYFVRKLTVLDEMIS